MCRFNFACKPATSSRRTEFAHPTGRERNVCDHAKRFARKRQAEHVRLDHVDERRPREALAQTRHPDGVDLDREDATGPARRAPL